MTTQELVPTRSSKIPLQAYIVISIGVLAVSLASILIKLAQAEAIPSPLIAASRMTIAAIVLTPITLSRYRTEIQGLKRNQFLLAAASGLFLAIHFATWVKSFEYTSVLVGVVLVNTNPLWAAILEVIFLRAKLSRWVIIGLAVGILGSIIVALPSGGALHFEANTGSLLALIGAVAVAVYFVIGRNLRATLSLLPYIWLVYSCAAIFLILLVIANGVPILGYSLKGYLLLIATAIIPQLIGHSSLNFALRYFPASYVGIAAQLEPALSAIVAFLLFTEIPTGLQIIGSVVILSGVILASLSQTQKA
ncbi:MAG: DMT family transporter [Anaerolineae bacterium]|nr:DMT family transporter [Anaerolineae bacterium]